MNDFTRRPSVAVVIPTYHDWAGLRRCLDAIAAQTYPRRNIETFVINNDPDDPFPAYLMDSAQRSELGRIRTLTEARRGSYAARNAGIAASRSEIVAFTDSDCVPETTWLEQSVKALERGVDRVAGRIAVVPAPGALDHAAVHEIASAFDQPRYVRRGFGATANLVVKRRAFDLIGPFDATLLSGGDIEWNRRAERASLTLQYVAEATVAHPARATEAELLAKDARVWTGKVTIEEFPLPVLAIGAALQGLIPPLAATIRAGRRTRGMQRGNLAKHFVWLWRFRCRRSIQRISITMLRLAARPKNATPERASVVVAVGSLVGGGAERSSLLIARHWPSDHPLRPRLMVRELAGPFIHEIPDWLPVDVVGSTRVRQIPMFLWSVRRAVRRHEVKAIVSNSRRMSDVLLFGRRLRLIPCKIIVVERTGEPKPSGGVLSRPLQRWIRSCASSVVAVSQGIEQRLRVENRFGSVPRVVIHNAAALTDRASDQASEQRSCADARFVSVGRLEPIKNHLLLLEAFRGLPSDLQGSLTILGEGSLRPLLAERIVELGLGDRVQMPGFVTDPEDTLRASDVFVLSSDFEGHPRVLIEALLCGLRIVATDCPTGPREILEGVAGALLVPPGDALALRAGMVQMAQAALSGTRARSSEQTAALVERFDPSAMARRYASLVSQVLG